MLEIVKMDNFQVEKESNSVIISVNPKIFPLEVIYSAAYVFLDRAYIMMDGNPQENISVQLKAKSTSEDLQSLGLEFNNELVSYAVYVVQAARSTDIRKAIVERALATVGSSTETNDSLNESTEVIDDPLGISKPWTPASAEGIESVETDE
jgi:His-Xaa-Ser system protein HxsD